MSEEHKINEEIKEKAKEAEMSLEDAMKPLFEGYEALTKDAREAFKEMKAEADKDWKAVKEETKKSVHENPMLAIAAAAGIGLLVGILGSRRR